MILFIKKFESRQNQSMGERNRPWCCHQAQLPESAQEPLCLCSSLQALRPRDPWRVTASLWASVSP